MHVYLSVCVCLYVCICLSLCFCVFLCVCMCVCMCTCVCVCLSVYLRLHVCVSVICVIACVRLYAFSIANPLQMSMSVCKSFSDFMCLDVTIFLLFVRLLEFLNVAAVADKALSCPLSSAKQRSCYRVITYKLINRIEQ